jgi:hypothetical protein
MLIHSLVSAAIHPPTARLAANYIIERLEAKFREPQHIGGFGVSLLKAAGFLRLAS